jgi:very-short-patch-repair endonuclease/serine phosphatase RsbU (regulator of sigma subunit)
MVKRFAYLFFGLLLPVIAFAESASDSFPVHKGPQSADTVIVEKNLKKSRRLADAGEYDKADSFALAAISLSRKIGYGKGCASAYYCRGTISFYRGNMDQAVDYFNKGLEIAQQIGNKKTEALAYNDLGITYEGKGEYSKALEYHFMALKVREDSKNQEDIANSLGSIAEVYFQEMDFAKSLDYAQRSEKLAESIKDTIDMVSAYNDIADVYDAQHHYPMALEIDLKMLTIYQRRGEKMGTALTMNNIADVYYAENNYPKALEYYDKALKLAEEMDNRHGMSLIYFNMGNIYTDTKDFKKALDYENKSLELAKEINSPDDIRTAEQSLERVYEALGDNMKALQHFKNYIAVRDSLFSQESTKKTVQTEMNYEFAKKQAAEKADQDKKDALQKVQARKQRLTLYFISGILALVVGFAAFAYRSYLQKQKANQELDEKNSKIENAYSTIEQKNKEITDSINYARRIQQAMLPDIGGLTKVFPESFILFKPKDIVSGDFYWMGKAPLPADATLVAAADCTGHGVPGAFMSMIGSEKLHDAIQQTGNAGEALQLLNKGIRTSLRQSSEGDTTRDGMDIALCSIKRAPLSPPEGGNKESFGYEMADAALYKLLKEFAQEHRSVPTEAENVCWQLVRGKNLEGYKFRRQHIIGQFIVDFVCLSNRLIVEIDGLIHQLPENKASDEERTRFLNERGFHVVRFKNEEVIGNPDGVSERLIKELKSRPSLIPPSEGGEAWLLEYAGANRPLWILRKGSSEMEEIKATKKAIGGFTEEDAVFDVHGIKLNRGDTFYIFSDGYADQFGGKDGKKMTTRKFREFLLSLKDEVMSAQHKRLDAFIEEWKGDREQLDDILVIGIRV